MDKLYGWMGKVLQAHLSSSAMEELDISGLAEKFIGGRGFTAQAYWNMVTPSTDALGPENCLMLMAGPLAGTPAIACSRLVIGGKSPLLYPEQYGHATVGGSCAIKLKAAGFDGIIISGKASAPSLLYVSDAGAQILDAGFLWGLDTHETLKKIREKFGSQAEALCIGPAGERKVRFAIAMSYNGSCGAHGFGAVMGSKNLKAIVFAGSGRVPIARPLELQQINREIRSLIKGRQLLNPLVPGMELVKRAPCHGCPAGCARGIYKGVSGTLEHRKNCASSYFYYDYDKTYHKGEASGKSFDATTLADRVGMCTQELTKLLWWITSCVEQGIITEAESGLPFSMLGSSEFLNAFVQSMLSGSGFGDILAQGTMRASRALGKGSDAILKNILEGSGFTAGLYNARFFITNAIFHATDQTNPMAQLHEVCYPLFKWVLWYATDGAMSQVTTEAFRKIGRKFWKSEDAVDFSKYEGKGEVAFIIQNREYAKETLVACDFFFPIVTPEGAVDHVGDPGIESRLLSAVTGVSYSEDDYYRAGERVFNLTRAIQAREGHAGRGSDVLPEFNFTEPLAKDDSNYFALFNPEFMLPGPGGELISRKGAVLDREKFQRMLDEYYTARGWDVETGLQTKSKLEDLGLKDIIPELASRNLIKP